MLLASGLLQTVYNMVDAIVVGQVVGSGGLAAVSIGGDSDTIASMAGAVAAAFYGIPRDIRDQAMAYLDGEVYTIYDRFSRQY